MRAKTLEDFLNLRYPVRLEYDEEDDCFIAVFPDLPGCSASGASVAEAYDNAEKARHEWLRVALAEKLPVPEPSKASDYSGRILLRIPVALHASLADRARINGVSLNQYIVHLLSAGAVGEEINSKLHQLTGHLQEVQWQFLQGTFSGASSIGPRGALSSSVWQQFPSGQLSNMPLPLGAAGLQ